MERKIWNRILCFRNKILKENWKTEISFQKNNYGIQKKIMEKGFWNQKSISKIQICTSELKIQNLFWSIFLCYSIFFKKKSFLSFHVRQWEQIEKIECRKQLSGLSRPKGLEKSQPNYETGPIIIYKDDAHFLFWFTKNRYIYISKGVEKIMYIKLNF